MVVAEQPVSTAAAPAAVAVTAVSTDDRVMLRGVAWDTYEILRAPDTNNHVRMSYDEGKLEIMSPSGKHARVASVLGHMIYEWTLQHGVEMHFGGDMTLRRRDVSRGVEADSC